MCRKKYIDTLCVLKLTLICFDSEAQKKVLTNLVANT